MCLCPWPKEVVEALQNIKNSFIVREMESIIYLFLRVNDGQFENIQVAKRQLQTEQIQWLGELPERVDLLQNKSIIETDSKTSVEWMFWNRDMQYNIFLYQYSH